MWGRPHFYHWLAVESSHAKLKKMYSPLVKNYVQVSFHVKLASGGCGILKPLIIAVKFWRFREILKPL
jgi:hypothetical protein